MNRYDCQASPPHVKAKRASLAKRASSVNRAHMNSKKIIEVFLQFQILFSILMATMLVFVYVTSVKVHVSITKTRLYSQGDVHSGLIIAGEVRARVLIPLGYLHPWKGKHAWLLGS
jgi:hypothetical protein